MSEYIYKSYCTNCKLPKNTSFGSGPLKKNHIPICDKCGKELKVIGLSEGNIVNKKLIIKPLNIGVLNG